MYVLCDRTVTRRRIGITAPVTYVPETIDHATVADALQSMASRVRTGVSANEAFEDELTNFTVNTASFAALVESGVALSNTPSELEQRASHHRSLHLMDHDLRVHTAQARASTRVLTIAPLLFLGVMLIGSASLRSRMVHSPMLLTGAIVGLALNFVSRRWMSRLIEYATLLDVDDQAVADIHQQVSAALMAGHTIAEALLVAHAKCSTRGRDLLDLPTQLLTSGGTLTESLSMIAREPHLRSLARVLTDSQRHGTPVASIAEQLTSTAHRVQRSIIDERIRRLPVRLAAPLIAGVLPAFILLAVMPLVAASMGSFDVAPPSL